MWIREAFLTWSVVPFIPWCFENRQRDLRKIWRQRRHGEGGSGNCSSSLPITVSQAIESPDHGGGQIEMDKSRICGYPLAAWRAWAHSVVVVRSGDHRRDWLCHLERTTIEIIARAEDHRHPTKRSSGESLQCFLNAGSGPHYRVRALKQADGREQPSPGSPPPPALLNSHSEDKPVKAERLTDKYLVAGFNVERSG